MKQDKQGFYEGYGPGGAAIHLIIDTEDIYSTWGQLKLLFKEFGGAVNLAGNKPFLFHQKAVLTVNRDTNLIDEDQMMLMALGAGADEVIFFSNHYEIIVDPKKAEEIQKILEVEGLEIAESRLSILPKKTIDLIDKEIVNQFLDFIQALEQRELNIMSIAHNAEFPEGMLERLNR